MLRALPVHTSNTLLHDALDLLKHVGIFFINPVSQVSTIVQDLTIKDTQERDYRQDVRKKEAKCEKYRTRAFLLCVFTVIEKFVAFKLSRTIILHLKDQLDGLFPHEKKIKCNKFLKRHCCFGRFMT